jgi:hypothetical protein
LLLEPSPVRFTAEKSLVHIAVLRYGQLHCAGAIGGQLHLRRAGFVAVGTDPVVVEHPDHLDVTVTTDLTLDTGALSDADLTRGLV